MIRRTAVVTSALAVAMLLAPIAALADVPIGGWEITGIVVDGNAIAATGKLSFDGSVLSMSAGCNGISAKAEADGSSIKIVGDPTTTLIGCPAAQAAAESALLKILAAGSITPADGKWTNSVGEIDVLAVGAGGANDDVTPPGCIPPIAPGANPPADVTVPCGNGGSTTGSNPSSPAIVDTTRDVLFVPLAIGFGILVVITVVLLVRPGRKPASTDHEGSR